MRDWLYPGAKVQCVDDEWRDPHPRGWPCPLVKGAVYSVKEIMPPTGWYMGSRKHFVITLAELQNVGWRGEDVGFATNRFRPLQKRQTDISIFTRLLVTPPKEKVEA